MINFRKDKLKKNKKKLKLQSISTKKTNDLNDKLNKFKKLRKIYEFEINKLPYKDALNYDKRNFFNFIGLY